MPEETERLGKLLHEWRVDAPLPPRFQEQVWHRIARAEPRGARSLWSWLEIVLPQPKPALAYIAALMILGMAAGSVTAQIRTSHVQAALSAQYVQSVNPYQAEVTPP